MTADENVGKFAFGMFRRGFTAEVRFRFSTKMTTNDDV
jgi:hypothetical protein